MVLFYERINWENYPSMNTAINALNLNKIDLAVKTLDERTVQLNTTKAEQATVLNTVQDWSLDESTGIITITKVNGENILFDLNIEKIPVNFELSEDGILTMTTDDGTVFTADIGSMIPIIELEGSSTVSVTKEKVITELATNIKNFSHTFEEPFTGKICIKASFNQTYNAKIITEDGEIGGFVSGPYFPYVKKALSFSVESTNDLERIYLDYSQIQKYKIEIPDGAITEQKLNPNYLADINLQAENATQSATSASTSATQASESATRAYDEAERAKLYADTVQEGITTTTSRTLTESHAGGLKINSMYGESQQNGTPTPDAEAEIKSVEVSEIWSVGENLINQKCVGTSLATPIWLKSGTYTVSRDASEANGAWYFKATTKDNAIITSNALEIKYATLNSSGEWYYAGTSAISYTFIVLVDCYVTIASINGSGNTYLMLVRGSEALPYEPYTESKVTLSAPITLRGIGNVKDVLCKRDGVFGVLRGIGVGVFDNTANWGISGSGNFIYLTGAMSECAVSNNVYTAKLMSNYSYAQSYDNMLNAQVDYGVGISSSGSPILRIKECSTLEDYLAYLSAKPLQIIAEITSEPVVTDLPTADQIALHQLETFDTVTYLSTDSEIEPIMEVEYGTSKVGAYAIKGMNTAEANALKIEQLNTLTNELATQLVAGSEV